MKDPNDKITPNKIERRGGWREGGGSRPKGKHETKAIRIDVRLLGIVESLKTQLKSGAMNDEDLKKFKELVAN